MSKELRTKTVIDMTLRIYINENFNTYEPSRHLKINNKDEITEKVLFEYISDYFTTMTHGYCPFCYEEIDFKIVEPIKYVEEEEIDFW